MRLLTVTHYFSEHRGGIEIVAGELARRLAQRDVNVWWAASALPEAIVSSADGPKRFPMPAWNITEPQRLGFLIHSWSPVSLGRRQ